MKRARKPGLSAGGLQIAPGLLGLVVGASMMNLPGIIIGATAVTTGVLTVAGTGLVELYAPVCFEKDKKHEFHFLQA